MGIVRLPGMFDDVGPAIQNIVQAVMHIKNPNAALQRRAQELILSNPDVLQKFIDLETDNPGMLARLGLGSLGTEIGKFKPSPQHQLQRTIGDALATLTPEQRQQVLAKNLGFRDAGEQQQFDLATTARMLQIEAQRLQNAGVQSDQIFENSVREFRKSFAANRASLGNLYEGMKSGKIDQNVIQGALNDPAIWRMFEDDAQTYFKTKDQEMDQLRIDLEKERIGIARQQTNRTDPLFMSRQNEAEKYAFLSKTFDPDAMFAVLNNPTVIAQARTTGKFPDNPRLKAAIQGFLSLEEQNTAKGKAEYMLKLKSFQDNIEAQISKFMSEGQTARPEDVEAAVQAYNEFAQTGPAYGVPAKMATWSRRGKTTTGQNVPKGLHIEDIDLNEHPFSKELRMSGRDISAGFRKAVQPLIDKALQPGGNIDSVLAEIQKKRPTFYKLSKLWADSARGITQ